MNSLTQTETIQSKFNPALCVFNDKYLRKNIFSYLDNKPPKVKMTVEKVKNLKQIKKGDILCLVKYKYKYAKGNSNTHYNNFGYEMDYGYNSDRLCKKIEYKRTTTKYLQFVRVSSKGRTNLYINYDDNHKIKYTDTDRHIRTFKNQIDLLKEYFTDNLIYRIKFTIGRVHTDSPYFLNKMEYYNNFTVLNNKRDKGQFISVEDGKNLDKLDIIQNLWGLHIKDSDFYAKNEVAKYYGYIRLANYECVFINSIDTEENIEQKVKNKIGHRYSNYSFPINPKKNKTRDEIMLEYRRWTGYNKK